MRILTISANYPPYHSGGYGIRVKNIMDGLVKRGHEVLILTSKPGKPINEDQTETQYPIYRDLYDRYGVKSFPKEVSWDISDVNRIAIVVERFQPDFIYLGHIYPLTKQLLPFLSSLDIPIVSDEGGNSLKGAWTDHGRWFRLTGDYQPCFPWMNHLKPLVIRTVGVLSRSRIKRDWSWPKNLSTIFNSQQNREFVLGLGVSIRNSQVIYSGIDTEIFPFKQRISLSKPIKIISPGRIEPRKGQMEAIRLVASLKDRDIDAELILVGKVASDEYQGKIREEIERNRLDKQIQQFPMVTQDELVRRYHQADICFFPSFQEPGLSRIPLEAMACGCIVISYGNEGSDEIITDSENGFLVVPGDIDQVAQLISSLLISPTVVQDICSKARKDVTEKYSLPGYIDKIESIIKQAM